MRAFTGTLAVLLLTATGVQAEGRANPRELRRMQAMRERVEPVVQKEFGPKARIAAVFGRGSGTVVGVFADVPQEGTDVLPLMAVMRYDERTGATKVVDRAFKYVEACAVGRHTALLTPEGNLRLREDSGRERLLAQRVLGDLAPTAKGDGVVATLGRTGSESHETAVGLVDLTGRVTVFADAPGLDAMGTLSPDGKTVVFVSGRTTMASLFRTTVDGAEPVQLTNVGLVAGALRNGPPATFVPPPVNTASMEWLSEDRLRYHAGGGEFWVVDVRTGAASLDEGGAP